MDIIATLNHTSDLVKEWGTTRLSGGRSLAAALTVDALPLWDMLAVDLAVYHLPVAMASPAPTSTLERLRPRLSRFKHDVLSRMQRRADPRGKSPWPADATILCLAFTDYIYRDVLRPFALGWTDATQATAVSIRDRPWSVSREVGGGFQTVWQQWDDELGRSARGIRRAVRAVELEFNADDTLRRMAGSDSRTLERFRSVFRWYFNVHVPRLIPQAVVARHVLASHRPALVVSPDVADPRTRAYTLLAGRMGIPSLEIQFGPVGPEAIEWRFLAADCVAVWGEDARRVLIAHTVPEDRIVVTGSPRHDSLVNVSDQEVRVARAKLGVPVGTAMVVLASAYQLPGYDSYSNPLQLREMKRGVFEAARRTPGVFLVVKPHPHENVDETMSLAGKIDNVRFVDRASDIRDLTRLCDAFVSFGSTATADAIIAGKITICPIYPGWIWSDVFKSTGAVLQPTAAGEVLDLFQAIAKGEGAELMRAIEPARQRFLKESAGGADGLAGARIKSLALSLARLSQTPSKARAVIA